jgi:hypothetical protein
MSLLKKRKKKHIDILYVIVMFLTNLINFIIKISFNITKTIDGMKIFCLSIYI